MINLEWKFRSKANRARTLIKGSTITLVTGASRNSENGLIYELESSVKGSSSQSRLILLENPFMLCVYCSKLKLEWARFRSPFILCLCRICDDRTYLLLEGKFLKISNRSPKLYLFKNK